MTTADLARPAEPARSGVKPFDYLPVGFFGSVMGLTGLSVAWRLAAGRYGAPEWIADAVGWIAVAAFVALAAAYAAKAVTSFDRVRAEFQHPIAGNLFGTPIISLLLLPIFLVRFSPALAQAVWIVGSVVMVGFSYVILSRWLGRRQQGAHATPAWVVPVVGLLDIPLAAPALNLPHTHALVVFALGAGLFFATPLFTMIFSRLLFEEPLPAALRPTLMILVAPFAVGFSSYFAVVGHVDLFAEALFLIALLVFAVIAGRLKGYLSACPFRVSWWAVSFPVAAMAAAALRYADHAQSPIADALALGLLAIASIVIAALALRTILGILKGELRTLSA
jgi:tellurite resistance protein